MYELVMLTDCCGYIDCPTTIGFIKNGDTAYLIDSGNDKEAGRKVRQHLDGLGLKLSAIFNTHSNADHIGGNKYLQAQTGCKIYAPKIEAAFTSAPILEPSFLYGGFPPKELQNKFLMAQESNCELLTDGALPQELSSIPLSGHFFDMVGYRHSDGIVYLADCLFSEETIGKYHISFVYDVAAFLETLEAVKYMEAKIFVPSHAAPTENIVPLAQLNIDKTYEIAEKICKFASFPLTFEELLQKLFDSYNLTMNFGQYALVGSTLRSYLSWLTERGDLQYYFENNKMLWNIK